QEIIAIKAPKASCIEVPDPDEELGFRQRQYKMIVRSAIGPINLYLLSKDDRKFEDDSANRMKLMDPSWNSDSIRKRGVGLLESQHDEKNILLSVSVCRVHKHLEFKKLLPRIL
ncbi:Transcription factor E2FA, partial [Glycine soja]